MDDSNTPHPLEQARVYRADGAMRILFGLSIIDLMVMAGMLVVFLKLLPFGPFFNLVASIGGAWFLGQAFAKNRSTLPIEAMKQWVVWITQPSVYVPGPDFDARPLVFEPRNRKPK